MQNVFNQIICIKKPKDISWFRFSKVRCENSYFWFSSDTHCVTRIIPNICWFKNDSKSFVDKKVYVSSGFANTGYYGLSFDEDVVSPGIGITPIYWTKIRENTTLTDARVASIENINLTNPPSKVDQITLRKFDRILLKNQTEELKDWILWSSQYFVVENNYN